MLCRVITFALCFAACLAWGAAPAGIARAVAGSELAGSEPTSEECHAKVEEGRALAEALPAQHMSRYFAERYLQRALAEAGNGEFDECMEFAESAILEIRELRHDYPLGTKLNVLGPSEYPSEAGSQSQSGRDN